LGWPVRGGVKRVIHGAVPAAVLGYQGQVCQRPYRPVRAQRGQVWSCSSPG